MDGESHKITGLLKEWSDGRESAFEELAPLVYPELRRIAAGHLQGERRDHSLQPTALVNEAYIRLIDGAPGGWEDRTHFFGFSARLMRNILVDHARRRNAQKRGGGAATLTLVAEPASPAAREIEILALDDALIALGKMDPRAEKVVELKFFGGLTILEIAESTSSSPATVKRDWLAARAYLYQRLATV